MSAEEDEVAPMLIRCQRHGLAHAYRTEANPTWRCGYCEGLKASEQEDSVSDVPKQIEIKGELKSVYLDAGGMTITLEQSPAVTTRVTSLSRADVDGMRIGDVYRVFIEQVRE